jgi:hypothetical protein
MGVSGLPTRRRPTGGRLTVDERSDSTPDGPDDPDSSGRDVHRRVVLALYDRSDLGVGRREPDETGLNLHLLEEEVVVLERGRVAREEVFDFILDGRGEV